MMDDHELVAAAAAEMKAGKSRFLLLQLDLGQAMALLGTMQLALRHPDNRGPTAAPMKAIAHAIEGALAMLGPATAELAARGWPSSPDVAPADGPFKRRVIRVRGQG